MDRAGLACGLREELGWLVGPWRLLGWEEIVGGMFSLARTHPVDPTHQNPQFRGLERAAMFAG